MGRILFPKPVAADPAKLTGPGRPVGELQGALMRLDLAPDRSDIARKELGASTREALKKFQADAGLAADGTPTAETLAVLNTQVAHRFVATSKPRTARLHALLRDAGQDIPDEEVSARRFGEATGAALKAAQAALGLPQSGLVDAALVDALRERATAARLGTKRGVGQLHGALVRALRVAKLEEARLDPAELRGRKIGPTTEAAVTAFQAKYGLPQTGRVDAATMDRIGSVAAAVPSPRPAAVKPVAAAELRRLDRPARLNMAAPHVRQAQQALAFLGHRVEEVELREGRFGGTTRAAVLAFQRANGLAETGHVEKATLRVLNREIAAANPAAATGLGWRMRGSVRNELWKGLGAARVELWEAPVSGAPRKLAETRTQANGFYDLRYDPPREPATKAVRATPRFEIRAFAADGSEIKRMVRLGATRIDWANFTKGDLPYRGTSVFAERTARIEAVTGAGTLPALVETAAQRQISTAASATGLRPDDVLRLVLAHRVAALLADAALDAPALYAFLGQDLPAGLPGDLLASTTDFTLIGQLVDRAATALAFTEAAALTAALQRATALNLVPVETLRQRDAILAALAATARRFALEKPILPGNATLAGLLGLSAIPLGARLEVASVFLQHRGFTPEFWTALGTRAAALGGAANMADFRLVTELGEVAKNFLPMVTLLKARIRNPADAALKAPRHTARLTEAEWKAMIAGAGNVVPDGTDGPDPVATWAATLVAGAALRFPVAALTASLARMAAPPLEELAAIETLLDAHPDIDLAKDNLDKALEDRGLAPGQAVLDELRALQRIHRLAPDLATALAMVGAGLHSAAQIVGMGEQRLVEAITAGGRVDAPAARTLFERAGTQHAQVQQRIVTFHVDSAAASPAAVGRSLVPHAAGAAASLETLFGSPDYCISTHCQSVYGPAAYLADLLRFLDQHPSEIAGKTVLDILFDRRPDIGNVKLNCANTDTPLPYIDLVNEVLEGAVRAPGAAAAFANQTTRKAAELRAAPEHLREAAYTTLRDADWPMQVSFDLWQEQARVFLRHLGLPRAELMRSLQRRPAAGAPSPTEESIAGEQFGMSSRETGIVTRAAQTVAEQVAFWGLMDPPPAPPPAALPASLPVDRVMRMAGLGYEELLEALATGWVGAVPAPGPMAIERPDATCDTTRQRVVGITAAGLDRLHRLVRLRRRTGWTFRELDLLIRASAVCGGNLNPEGLARLAQAERLQARLRLPVERLLVLFGDIGTQSRRRPAAPDILEPSLWEQLFGNPAVLSPPDPAFRLPLPGTADLANHRAALLAAFGLSEAELGLLEQPGLKITVANLSAIGRRAMLARALDLPLPRLLAAIALRQGSDPFAGLAAMTEFLEALDWIAASRFEIAELSFLLADDPASPVGLRDAAVAEQAEAVRGALRGIADPGLRVRALAAQVASQLRVPSAVAAVLLHAPRRGGRSHAAILSDVAFLTTAADGSFAQPATAANFADVFAVLRATHKMGMLAARLELGEADLTWLFARAATFGLLSPAQLPVGGPPAAPLFGAWLELVRWAWLRRLFPEPEGVSLRALMDLSQAAPAVPQEVIRARLAALMQVPQAMVDEAAAALDLRHGGAASDYARIGTYLRIEEALRAARRAGVGPATLRRFALRDAAADQPAVAAEARQAARAKYDEATWLSKAAPLEDALREARRTALLNYLMAWSQRTQPRTVNVSGQAVRNPAWWADADDVLAWLLIDVGMGACQLTSRIKQAIGSVQMFVQRCLLGLEQPWVEVSRAEQLDATSLNSWRQWRWMRSYRVWEANRKVFLYPENWIEPELRDDKTPFYRELEQQLLSAEITDEAAADAFIAYLEKLQEVSRLEVVGTYRELDDADPRDNLPADINLLHVVARTRTQPATHYYRRFDLNRNEWSAWERVDCDVESEQVTPVVYNRRLYLFWLTFVEKPQKIRKMPPAKASDRPTDTPEPPNQLEIQLCWSARTRDGWSAKRMSRQKLIHPWQRPHAAYNLKPRYKRRENMLWLDLYVSQTPEFNSTPFWDAYRNLNAFVTARVPWDPTARPWHSSSFLFDGDVVDVRLKPLSGQYYVVGADGLASPDLVPADSLSYVRGGFGRDGAALNALRGPYETGPRLPLPTGMLYRGTRLVNAPGNGASLTVLERGASRQLLAGAKAPFSLVVSQDSIVFDTAQWGAVPFFYQDPHRVYLVRPEWQEDATAYGQAFLTYRYRWLPAYHPYAALFLREAKRAGPEGLLQRRLQVEPQGWYPGNNHGFASYGPTAASVPDATAVADRVDFARHGAFAVYNWEVFFHIPFAIACRLSENRRFEEAMRWFHYIFDPTSTSGAEVPQRYWVTRPFFEQSGEDARRQRIENLLRNIGENLDQLSAWRNNPFQPHVIARHRPVAYQKAVVMRYIDNLIAWGDQLFRQDTIEAINEATTLYVLAHELLGRRPVAVPAVGRAEQSYNELTGTAGLDPFANRRVDVVLENYTGTPVRVTRTDRGAEPSPTLEIFYFGIPHNDRLLTYWDTVEDRLFKIRNCMNISGAVRQLPLFEPPIDPALLIRAAAAGIDIGQALAGLDQPIGPYRFRRIAATAAEFCAEVRNLGERLLGALERRDAAALETLRSGHEVALQKALREVRRIEADEAVQAQAALEKALDVAATRRDWYASRETVNAWEVTSLTLGGISAAAETAIAVGYALVGGLALIPGFVVGGSGFGGTPHATVKIPEGVNWSKASEGAVLTLSAIARAAEKLSGLAATAGQFQRRKEDWDFQKSVAEGDMAQIQKQILAAKLRAEAIAKDIERLDLQLEQAQAVDAYLRSRYTSEELYDWQARQISAVHFQAYQLAFDMARRAERCFRFEMGDEAASFVQFGHWDSLRRGLLAGERLGQDIRRMQAAYLERDTRDLEITRHVSLAQLFPAALVQLRAAGSCTVTLPEWLFDMDYPGHYMRRLRSVSVTIPCVVGPYASVSCMLSLVSNGIRLRDDAGAAYGDPLAGGDGRFQRGVTAQSAIATSGAQDDSGMFELRFDDERYLPFEGAGAVSQWRLELPAGRNQFDLSTLRDVVLHLRYTARAGGPALTAAARANLNAALPAAGTLLLALHQDFAAEWVRFLRPEAGATQALRVALEQRHLPFFARGRGPATLAGLDLVVEGAAGQTYQLEVTRPGAAVALVAAAPGAFGPAPVASLGGFPAGAPLLGDWVLKLRRSGAADFASLPPEEVRAAWLLLRFATA
jgi:peptidoglycan hydrolase-like protein with peptidoglycan-binding domain